MITGISWSNPEVEAFIRGEIDKGCGDLGSGCVEYEVVVEFDAEFPRTADCPVRQVRIPQPTFDGDVPDTPYRDDLITIAINDPCDGLVASTPPPAGDSD